MATELEQKKALIDAGIATNEDKRAFIELGGRIEGDKAILPSSGVAPQAPAAVAGAVDFEDEVDIGKFKEGGDQYYLPSEEGFWRSELAEIDKPSFSDKDLKIFSFETNDSKLKIQGRGAVWVEMSKGAFTLKTILDGIGIPYTIEK